MKPSACLLCPYSRPEPKPGHTTMLRCWYEHQAYGWCGRVVAVYQPGRELMVERQSVPTWCRAFDIT